MWALKREEVGRAPGDASVRGERERGVAAAVIQIEFPGAGRDR